MINEEICDTMIKMAKDARMKSYSPYSKIKVGACILASDGTLYSACNVENGSMSLTVCAERAAVYKAVSDGKREFDAVAVVADSLVCLLRRHGVCLRHAGGGAVACTQHHERKKTEYCCGLHVCHHHVSKDLRISYY